MRAQVSIEVILLAVILLGLVAIVATQLTTTAKEMGEEVSSRAHAIINSTGGACAEVGEPCSRDEDCCTGLCYGGRCV